MSANNDIVLRPRFQKSIPYSKELVLKAFEMEKSKQSDFVISRVDDHVFIKYPKHKQELWTPQLHLEINDVTKTSSLIYGLFGPNPTVWTLFMFLHFIVACLFLALCIWGYSNWSLGHNFSIPLTFAGLMIIIWFMLYFAGSIGKNSNKPEMHKLHEFMNRILKTLD